MTKKELMINRLINKLTEEKNKVNESLINGEHEKLVTYQKHAFLTGKALRKILKLND